MNIAVLNTNSAYVLIVDPSPESGVALADWLAEGLTEPGYPVWDTTALPAAIAQFQKLTTQHTPVALVLLALQWPEGRVDQLCPGWLATLAKAQVPVMFLGSWATSDREQAYALGGVDYLPQPYVAAEVVARVKLQLHYQALQQQTQACPKKNPNFCDLADKERLHQELEQSLQASQAQLQSVLDNAIASIVRFRVFPDRTWCYEYQSVGSEAMFGYTAAEIMADPALWISRVVPEDWENILLPVLGEMMAGHKMTVEFRFQHKDNSIRWISATYLSEYQPDYDSWLVTGVSTDISDRKQAEAKLLTSQQLIETLTEAAAVILYVVDQTDQQNVYVSREIERLLGYSPAEVKAMGNQLIPQLVHPEDLPTVFANWEKLLTLDNGEFVETEYRMRDAQGNWHWLYGRDSVLSRDEQGRPKLTVGTATDLTERKQMEDAVHRSEERFQEIAWTIRQFFFVRSAVTGEFLYVSPAYEKIWGRSCASLYANPESWRESIYPADREQVDGSLVQQQTGEPVQREYRIVRPDGEVRWIAAEVSGVRDETGQVVRFVGLAEDISDRKHIELERQATQDRLRRGEAALREAQRIAHIGNWEYYRHNQELVWSEELFRIHGLEPGTELEVSPDGIPGFVHPEDQSFYQAQVVDKAIAGQPFEADLRIVRPDGTVRHIETRGEPLFDTQGQLIGYVGTSLDITERKQAEAALRASDARFRTIFEVFPDLFFRLGADGTILEYQTSQSTLLYTPPELFLNRPLQEVLPPESTERLLRGMRQALQTQTVVAVEYELPMAGEMQTFEARLASLPEQELIAVVRNISDRKQAEARLLKNEAILKEAQRVAHVSNWEFDIATQKITWSEEMFYIFGLDPAQGEPDYPTHVEMIHPEDRGLFQFYVNRAIAQGIPYELDFRILHNDGSLHYVEGRGKVETDATGKVIRLFGTGMDVTERKLAEEALRQSEQKFKGAFNTISSGMSLMSPVGGFLEVNASLCQMLGYSETELLSQGLESIVHPEDQHLDTELVERMFAALITGYQIEKRFIHKQGHSLWGLLSVALMRDDQGQPLYVIVQIADISDRKQAEAALQQAKEAAEAANLAKSTFLANMSHELRTPLNAILGFAQLLTRDPHLQDKYHKQLNIILSSGEHLLNLINDILEMSKIDVGQIRREETCFDLPQLLHTLLEMLRLRAESKGLKLLFESDAQLPRFVRTDENKLRQILINLLGNALKFTQQGTVILRAYVLQPANSGVEPEALVHFAVEDTGPGIPPEEMEGLFQAFVQTSAGRQSQQGTGLGLSISSRFVRLLGGELTVRSVVGQGSVFAFTIPLMMVNAEQMAAAVPEFRRVVGLAPNQPLYRILVVEDIVTNRKLVTECLSRVGFEVREAVNGQEAIALWETWAPHLILMDMQMPVMNGYQATQRIREIEQMNQSQLDLAISPRPRTVIVALTASAFEEQRSPILEAGCDDCIHKPFKADELLVAIGRYLGVQYCYEERSEPAQSNSTAQSPNQLTEQCLMLMSPEWRAELCRAIRRLSPSACLKLIQQIPPDHAALIQGLTNLVKSYQFEALLSLGKELESWTDESSESPN